MQKSILNPVNEKVYGYEKKAAMSSLEKAVLTFLPIAPISYYQSAKQEEKARRGEPLSSAENFVRKNPFLTAVGTTAAARGLISSMKGTFDRGAKAATKGSTVTNSTTSNSPFPGSAGMNKRAKYLNQLSPETINSIYNEIIS